MKRKKVFKDILGYYLRKLLNYYAKIVQNVQIKEALGNLFNFIAFEAFIFNVRIDTLPPIKNT